MTSQPQHWALSQRTKQPANLLATSNNPTTSSSGYGYFNINTTVKYKMNRNRFCEFSYLIAVNNVYRSSFSARCYGPDLKPAEQNFVSRSFTFIIKEVNLIYREIINHHWPYYYYYCLSPSDQVDQRGCSCGHTLGQSQSHCAYTDMPKKSHELLLLLLRWQSHILIMNVVHLGFLVQFTE